MSEMIAQPSVGNLVVVTGLAGAGKSTFSRRLASATGLPLIHLDLHLWDPGWVRVSASELLAKQQVLMAADQWIVDSNDVDEELLRQRADTLVVLATPWWVCAFRAFRRGLRRPPGAQLPDGCEESFVQRIRDEWGITWRHCRQRNKAWSRDVDLAKRSRDRLSVFVLASTAEHDEWFAQHAPQ